MAAVIEASGLSKHFGATTALDSLDLRIPPGEVFGFLGPNGAGKTTTIRLLLGLIRPSAGSARIHGHDAWSDPVEAHRHVAVVPADPALWPQLTAHETFDLLGNLHGGFDAGYRDELIERFELEPDKKVRAFSTGNRQKVALIAAFMKRADVLIFDEPTSGLDPLRKVVFRECLAEAKQRGQTVFLSSHLLIEVEASADRVGLLRRGRLVEVGTFEELRHLSAVRIDATFPGEVPEVEELEGVEDVRVDGRRLSFHVHGPIAPVLEAIAPARPIHLTSREPSLEDLFLARYGAED
ncbi:MAG: ABC transporter ATP-binding protein [Solirubrobacterales bacterium]